MKKTKIITSLVFSAMTIILGCFIYLKPFSKQIAGEQDEISAVLNKSFFNKPILPRKLLFRMLEQAFGSASCI
jgi:hypothetical protein